MKNNAYESVTVDHIQTISYVEFMAFLDEVNRPPGGKTALRLAIQNSFINKESKVLDVGCNTGYCTFEIAHLTKCNAVGVDISSDMVAAAERYRQMDPLRDLVNFQVADGMNLPFSNDSFDVVFSGGSTAFIDDQQRALKEYVRVTKPWGFVVDINFFYREEPSSELLMELNELLGINIKPWKHNYWDQLYASCGLESYYRYTQPVALVSEQNVRHYAQALAQERGVSAGVEAAIVERLQKAMSLFNRNHEFLSWGVFVNRKRPFAEQVTLFE